MEKQQNESNTEVVDMANDSTDPHEFRHENAENSESFPPQEKTNTPETNQIEEAGEPTVREENPQDEQESDNESDSQIEGRVAELEQRLEQSEEARREGEEKLSAAQESLEDAVSRYRAILLKSMPEAPESMVGGETVDEVDRSFADARALVQQVRREVEEKLAKERLPAGSPTRGTANFATLTPMQKIRSALTS